MVRGKSSSSPATGSVTKICRRSGGHAASRDAEARPHRERTLEGGHVTVLGDEKQVTDLMEMRIGPDLLRESLDVRQRALGELHVDLARELQPNAARVLPSRARAESVAFENENIAHTFLCQVVCDGSADDHATDDDHIGCTTHRRDGMQSPGPLLARIV